MCLPILGQDKNGEKRGEMAKKWRKMPLFCYNFLAIYRLLTRFKRPAALDFLQKYPLKKL